MIDLSKLTPKPGGSRFAPSGAVTDKVLLEIAGQYETAVSRKMTAVKPEELPRRFPGAEPVLETTKYDGEGVFVYYEEGKEPFAFNAYSGRVRLGLLALIEARKALEQQAVRKALFRAELYLPEVKEGKRSGIADVIRVSFSGGEADLARLRLAMLDIIMLDGKDLRPNQEHFQDTWQLLGRFFGPGTDGPCHRPEGGIVPENQIVQTFTTRTRAGQEGLVIRRLNRADLVKVKPHLTVDAAIIGYVEGEFEGQFGVTSILSALTYPSRQPGVLFFQTLARVGSGLTDAQRCECRELFSSVKIDPPIPMTDSDGRAVNFVKPGHILELEGDDLLLTGGGERENRTQLFGWNSDRFRFLGLTPCPRLTFPIFARLRSDKDLESGGARLEQIVKDPVLPALEKTAPGRPQVLRREVYTKAEAVRKLVVVRQPAENCVPYLVYWTDFSAKRKDPLKVSSAFAFTETRAQALAQKLIAENITKGFLRTDGAAPTAPATQTEPAKADPVPGPDRPSKPKKPRKG
jgi:hypothetical protein